MKKFFLVLLIALTTLAFWQIELLQYGVSQGAGQLKIVWNSQPVAEILDDPLYPDSIKNKIMLVQEVRQFCFDSLGLKTTKNYTTFYDQQGRPAMWVLTACAPFELKAKMWSFPLLGEFSYKGFFLLEKAKKEELILKAQGYDTSIDEVGGWSTLGWFKDPILSNMLNRKEGSLADLITHELTHGTLYIKNNVDFNENLASFVGEHGAVKFLNVKYGANSAQYKTYVEGKNFRKKYYRLVLEFASRLQVLYGSYDGTTSETKKLKLKQETIQDFVNHLKLLHQKEGKKYGQFDTINNTYFMDVKRYRQSVGYFENELKTKFNADFTSYLTYLKNKYPTL